jgi:tetratricopeptide (TPR) repeat protein
MSFGFSHRFSVDASGRPVDPATEAMAAAGRAYFARDLVEAERLCLALLEGDPRCFDALHLLGVVCLDRSRLSDAIGYLTRAARERPDDAQAHYHLGTALLGAKQFQQAETALRRAVALRPGNTGALNNLGNALAGDRRYQEAIDCYRQVLPTDAGFIPARFNLGRSLVALDRLDEAVVSFREALSHSSAETESRPACGYACEPRPGAARARAPR